MTRLVYLTAALLVAAGCSTSKPAESLPPDTTTTTVTQSGSPDMNSGTSSSSTSGSSMSGSSGSSMSGTNSSTGVTSASTTRAASGTGSSGTATTGTTGAAPAGGPTPTGAAQATAMAPTPGPNADNTAMNKKDRDGSNLTPMDQGGSEADRKVTQKIRQALMGDKNLSFTAKNVKVITINGKVTLRGAVKTDQERSSIESAAKAVAGDAQVDNQIEVKK